MAGESAFRRQFDRFSEELHESIQIWRFFWDYIDVDCKLSGVSLILSYTNAVIQVPDKKNSTIAFAVWLLMLLTKFTQGVAFGSMSPLWNLEMVALVAHMGLWKEDNLPVNISMVVCFISFFGLIYRILLLIYNRSRWGVAPET